MTVVVMTATTAGAKNFCGELKNAFGPFDYRARSENASSFELVESAHFTDEVENGVKGNTGQIGGDLDYTLRAIPNHRRALAALARVAVRTKSVTVSGAKYPVECYFERAMRFTPNDGGVRAEYGNYLFALGKTDMAFTAYKQAAELEPESSAINYNLGLAYFQRKAYGEARTYAKKAYALGFPLPGLKNKLAAVGKWDDKAE
jgi:tetratricopeptide (TPR) repeat protein